MTESGHRLTKPILAASIARDLSVEADEVEVLSFEVSPGSKDGDNYSCVMKAVEVEAVVKDKKISKRYMAKCYPMNEFRAKSLKEVISD